MPAKMDLAPTGVAFSDYQLEEVGTAAFELEHDFFIKQDLVIRTASEGGGTLLVETNDYVLADQDVTLSAKVSEAVGGTRHVYRRIQIVNATYQTGDLYFSGKYVADSNEAADIRIPKGYLFGLELSNNGVDPDNDIDIAIGECTDSAGEYVMENLAVRTIALDTSGIEGLDTGTKTADTTYHVHLIRKKVDGAIGAIFSLSPTAPTLPAGYTALRRLGAVITDGSGNLQPFFQDGDRFFWTSEKTSVSEVVAVTTRETRTIDVPNGIAVLAVVKAAAQSGVAVFRLFHYDEEDSAPSNGSNEDFSITGFGKYGAFKHLRTSTSKEIHYRASAIDGNVRIFTIGWIDRRGRDA